MSRVPASDIRAGLTGLRRRFGRVLSLSHGDDGERATVADFLAAYRLLLGRAPDDDARRDTLPRVEAGTVSVSQLVEEILGSEEFAMRHRRMSTTSAPEVRRVEADGFVLFVDMGDLVIGRAIAQSGVHEPETSAVVRGRLSPGDTMVDVGANIGWFTMLGASCVGPTGRVLAVEPNPESCRLVEQSAAANGFGNVSVVAAAASEHSGAAALETDGSNGRIVPLDAGLAESMACSYVVPLRRLDDLVAEAGLSSLALVKIDVEGAEPFVVGGGRESILRWHPTVVCEFSPVLLRGNFGSDPADYLKELRSLGYELSVVGREGTDDDETILSLFERDPAPDHVDLVATPSGP